jgi:hypothetical protein
MRVLFLSLFITSLYAQTPFTVILEGIVGNNLMRYSIKSAPFFCYSAAVNTHETFINSPNTTQACQTLMQKFIKKNPKMVYAHSYVLHEDITYMIEPHEGNSCFLYLNGGTTYSEYLVEKGFALLKNSHDGDFAKSVAYEKLTRAQARAKYHKKGVWGNARLANCFASLP